MNQRPRNGSRLRASIEGILAHMYPKISPMHADTVIENLYQAKEAH
jgi:hypothetical protein